MGLNPVSARLKPITDWEDMREGREDESWGDGPVLGVVAAMSMGADADAKSASGFRLKHGNSLKSSL